MISQIIHLFWKRQRCISIKINWTRIDIKNSVYEFQTAHICKDEELQAYVTGLTSELNANYSDDNVIKVPEVPEN